MILCDIDGVLATGPRGDTAVGQPIYRTAPELSNSVERIRNARIPFHVVTARIRAEAVQVLRAIGAYQFVDSVISADRLFWPTIWAAIRRGRVPGALSKSVCRTMLPADRSERVVMIENHHPHLYDMLAAGMVQFGILVPPITIADGRVRTWFDLDLALRLARELASGGVDTVDLTNEGVAASLWTAGAPRRVHPDELPARIEEGVYLLHIPKLSIADSGRAAPALKELDTGQILLAGPPNLVTTIRSGRQLFQRLTRLLARSS